VSVGAPTANDSIRFRVEICRSMLRRAVDSTASQQVAIQYIADSAGPTIRADYPADAN
jgi:hypothetical protein